jgi:hypothetical protein
MLMVLLLSLLLGASDISMFAKDDRRQVRREVGDEVRADGVVAAMDGVNELIAGYVERATASFDVLQEIDADPDASEDEYQAVLDELWTDREAVAGQYVDVVFEMRSQMTREEWEAVFGD